ncbi:hypothetical protein WOLCODRAFT_165558 [Wolfiporia cocos MD-104 SS10]|uniref:Bacterial surface antigen (D15) domain-containing protein n=1 Tax=Wolfiporia cocos (strain MD-104) TaxID=742152 RepID=A0A2H3K9C4_WOLCO|nr:hypothetical protein WOLCODRAFT_165558 [Wolfiporia cocos MD-104 SS10]
MDDPELTAPPLKPPLADTSAPRDGEPAADDVDRILRWQEERIARKLRGEYESAVLHLSDVVNSNLATPLRIASVRVQGAAHTRASFIGSLITPLLPLPQDPTTLADVLHTTRHVGAVLQQTDIFQAVDARLERARDMLDAVDVVFRTRERGRLFLSTSTQVGNNEGGASATCRVRNAFGGAETFEANLAFATTTRVAFGASLSAPLTHTLATRGELAVFAQERDNSSFASSAEGVRGLRAVVRTGSADSSRGKHEFAYEAVLRHIGNLAPTASITYVWLFFAYLSQSLVARSDARYLDTDASRDARMREAAGQSVKSAVSHTWTRDTRDDRLLGTRGAYVRLAHELAGLGGDAAFVKSEAQAQGARRLLPGLIMSLAGRTGLLWGLGRPTLFSDRFQLGGPLSVRMFRANGMGPRDGPDSLGGELYWAAGLSLISDIPRKPHWPVKIHGFVNAGRLDGIDQSKTLVQNVLATITKPSVSAGVGLVYKLDPVRIELNFGAPLVASASDGVRKGIQVGIGLDFL